MQELRRVRSGVMGEKVSNADQCDISIRAELEKYGNTALLAEGYCPILWNGTKCLSFVMF